MCNSLFAFVFNEIVFYFCRLAQRIVRGDVPEPLLNRKVVILIFLFPSISHPLFMGNCKLLLDLFTFYSKLHLVLY